MFYLNYLHSIKMSLSKKWRKNINFSLVGYFEKHY